MKKITGLYKIFIFFTILILFGSVKTTYADPATLQRMRQDYIDAVNQNNNLTSDQKSEFTQEFQKIGAMIGTVYKSDIINQIKSAKTDTDLSGLRQTLSQWDAYLTSIPPASGLSGKTVTETNTSNNICDSNGKCTYVLMAPVGTLLGNSNSGKDYVLQRDNTKSLCDLLNGWYKVGIGLAGLLAVVMIVIGGVEYATTDSITGTSAGRAKITQALSGLILALCTYLIFNTINPALTKCELQTKSVALQGVSVSSGSSGGTGTNSNGSTGNGGSLVPGSVGATGGVSDNGWAIYNAVETSLNTCQISAGTVENILENSGYGLGGGVGNGELYDQLKNNSGWSLVPGGLKDSLPGDVVVTPSDMSRNVHGHTGFVTSDGGATIASNSSQTGTISNNYTATSWTNSVEQSRGLQTYVYRKN